MIENVYKSEILFQKDSNGKYQFKFIKNRKNRSEKKKKLKMSFLIEANQLKKD